MVCSRRALGLIVVLCLFGFVTLIGVSGLARSIEETGEAGASIAQPYQQGPLETRDSVASPHFPGGAEELLGLSVLAAFLYGLRASGLGA
jgi:hypothetical protein